jgi:glutamine amidotransferase
MCRLFGFRSVIQSQVHQSLLAAENALGVQSHRHPDGWGVAFYVDGAPHVTRSAHTALSDAMFHRLSGVVASETVLAHVRQATRGPNTVLNCHPFQYGRWVGAHNGDIPNLELTRGALLEAIAPPLRRFVLGETDSELVFLLFLTHLRECGSLSRAHAVADVVGALRRTVAKVRALCDDEEHRALLTLLVTDGKVMVACHGGRQLFYSTYKGRCGVREDCPSLSPECEAPTESGFVNHLIVSSEPLQGENIWIPLSEGDVVGVGHRMQVVRGRLDRVELPVLGLEHEDPRSAPAALVAE